MATIYKRSDNQWRLQIRRKGIPLLSLTFMSYQEAVEWEREHEDAYMNNPAAYADFIKTQRLMVRGERRRRRRARATKLNLA